MEEGGGEKEGERGEEREKGQDDLQYMFPLPSVMSTQTERLQWQLLLTWPKPLPVRAQLQSRGQRSSSTTLATTVWMRVWSTW